MRMKMAKLTRTNMLLCIIAAGLPAGIIGCKGEVAPPTTQKVKKYSYPSKDEYKPEIGRYGGQFVIASFGEGVKTFNPITAGETSTTDYTSKIFDALLFSDPWTQEIGPNLAESWEHSDDYLTWTFHLRKDVKFNNGTPFTADDVVFTFETIFNPEINSASRDIMQIDGRPWQVEKIDPHTVRITLPGPYAIFLQNLTGTPMISKENCQEAVKKGTFNAYMGAESTPDQVVGTGPFMVEEYIPGQRLFLKRNPHYWRKDAAGNQLPYLERFVVRWTQNYDGMMLAFQSGQTSRYFARGVDYPILKPMEKEGQFKIYELGPEMSTTFLTFNQNPEKNPATGQPYLPPHKVKWFRNTKFRQALSHCIDRVGIGRTIYNGLAQPQYGPLNENCGFFNNPNKPAFEYDLEKARKMLTEIDLKDRDGDGILEDSEGNPVEFTLMTNAGNNLREQTSEIIRKDLAELGIQVNLKYIEFNTLITKLGETFDWEAIVLGLTGGTEPHFGANVWLSSARTHMWYPKQQTPSTAWEARIDEIFQQGIKIFEPEKRKKLYDEWQMIATEQQPFIYTVSPLSILPVRNKFGNVYPTPIARADRQPCSWNIYEVYIKEGYPLD